MQEKKREGKRVRAYNNQPETDPKPSKVRGCPLLQRKSSQSIAPNNRNAIPKLVTIVTIRSIEEIR